MNFKFSNLLGAPYRGGNVLLHSGTFLFTPVGNRVSVLDLQNSQTETLPFENGANISRIAVSPNGVILLSIDENGRAIAVNVKRRVVLHHFSFKDAISAIKFSPDGRFFAAAVGKLVQVWNTPTTAKSFAPFHLHRTYAACQDSVTCLDWSPDSQWIVAGSRDLTARIFSIQPLKAYKPVILGGHREPLVAVFFRPEGTGGANGSGTGGAARVNYGLYTLAKDGALFDWSFTPDADMADPEPKVNVGAKRKHSGVAGEGEGGEEEGGREANGRREGEGEGEEGGEGEADGEGKVAKLTETNGTVSESAEMAEMAEMAETTGKKVAEVRLDAGHWKLDQKHFFMQSGAKLSAADYHAGLGILVACFSTGVFGIYQLPDFTPIHLLSISRERISTVAFNDSGDWIAFGCAKLGQLLVWEWRSETYVLKQQGHYFDVNAIAFSPDGSLLATGGDDNKLKLWNVSSGFCFVTLSDHTLPITSLAFLPTGAALLSASLDGTVRAWDLLRYRNYRTFTAPTSTQFMAMAVNPGGDIVCASSLDDFQEVLASASWDSTVRIWDVFESKGGPESLSHSHDVMALAFRPDGREVASATLDGQIYLWDPLEGELRGTIEGRRDVGGGRRAGDRQTNANSSGGKCFTCLSYTADGAMLLAGGSTKYVCCYDVAERVLLRRFELSSNKSLDGLLDQLNSRRITDAGPLDLLDLADSEEEREEGGGGQRRANLGGGLPGAVPNRGRPTLRSKSLQIAPSGGLWAAATSEGVMMWRQDEGLVFDPADLDVHVTPQAVLDAIQGRRPTRALQLALRLNEPGLLRRAVEAVPGGDIGLVLRAVPAARLGALLTGLAAYVEESPHLEFVLRWCQEICLVHRRTLEKEGSRNLLPAMRAIQKGVTRLHEDLNQSCGANTFLLQFLTAAPLPKKEKAIEETDGQLAS